MPSLIIKRLKITRRKLRTPQKRGVPTPSADVKRTKPPTQQGVIQAAYDQVVQGLETLSEHFPEAHDILAKFQAAFHKWSAGKSEAKAQGEPGAEETPPEEAAPPAEGEGEQLPGGPGAGLSKLLQRIGISGGGGDEEEGYSEES